MIINNLERNTKALAEDGIAFAQEHGSAQLFLGTLGEAIDLALALECDGPRPTAEKIGRGIGFSKNDVQPLTYYAWRPGIEDGTVSLAINDEHFSRWKNQIEDLCSQLSASPGVPVPRDGNRPWPVVGYRTLEAGRQIFKEIKNLLLSIESQRRRESSQSIADALPPANEAPEDSTTKRIQQEIWARRGQRDFRNRLLKAYDGQCAFSYCKVIQALEAAHITPHAEEQTYKTSAGILLRADIHTLFDVHLITYDPVREHIRTNPTVGEPYRSLDKNMMKRPEDIACRPDFKRLQEHFNIWDSLLGWDR